MITALVLTCALMLASCSHDARRENPLDPDLTPAVAVVAAVDDSAGTIALVWGSYRGKSRFGAYLVLRNHAQRTIVDTLARLDASTQTSFVDTTALPNTAYEYRVSVRTGAGIEAPSLPARVNGYSVEAVELLEPETDERSIEIGLRWRRFRGAGFQAYRVERRLVGEEDEFQAIHRTVSMADTAFADASILPDARYIYQVVVEAAGQDWVSNRTGREGLALSDVLVVQAEADPARGLIRVGWTMAGGPGFEAYQVVRSGPAGDVLVYESTTAADTMFADSLSLSGVDYTYTVLVHAGGRVLVSDGIEAQVELPGVDLQGVELDAGTAIASLSWSRYGGRRFQGYRVERRTAELASQEVALIDDADVTSWSDSGLEGNTRYFYRIVVVTDLGEKLVSNERDGLIHGLVQSWPLDNTEDEFVRLYWEHDLRLRALLATEHRVRLLTLDADGGVVSEHILWEHETRPIYAESASTALLSDGSRVLCLRFPSTVDGGTTAILQYDAQNQPVLYERELLTDGVFSRAEGVDGIGTVLVSQARGSIEEVTVTASGQDVLRDDFESSENSLWDVHVGIRSSGRIEPVSATGSAFLSKTDSSWHDVSTSVKGILQPTGILTVRVGSLRETYLVGQVTDHSALIRWRFELGEVTQSITLPILLPLQTPFEQRLGFVDGRPSFTLSQPPYVAPSADVGTRRAGVAAVGDVFAMLDGSQPTVHAPDQEPNLRPALDGIASELRIWAMREGGQTRPWLGVCLPERHQVRFAPTSINQLTGELGWSLGFFARTLGTLVGQLPGSFLFPLSLAGSADGRIYVLDAGNARVQVFGLDGEYITQWGRAGVAKGEFDFGSGLISSDFAGSVAVDDDGFIYVADVGNRRIQKFSP